MKQSPAQHARACGDFAQSAAVAADSKHGPDAAHPCPYAAQLFAAVHAALECARRCGTPRCRVEARLGMGTGVLSDYLSAKPRYQLRLDHLARLMFDPSVLGDEAHRVLVSRVAMGMGRRLLAAVAPADADALPAECLDLFDVVGAVAEEARDAQHPDSPGGVRITRMEHESIGARAGVVMQEAAQLVPGRDAHDDA